MENLSRMYGLQVLFIESAYVRRLACEDEIFSLDDRQLAVVLAVEDAHLTGRSGLRRF